MYSITSYLHHRTHRPTLLGQCTPHLPSHCSPRPHLCQETNQFTGSDHKGRPERRILLQILSSIWRKTIVTKKIWNGSPGSKGTPNGYIVASFRSMGAWERGWLHCTYRLIGIVKLQTSSWFHGSELW